MEPGKDDAGLAFWNLIARYLRQAGLDVPVTVRALVCFVAAMYHVVCQL